MFMYLIFFDFSVSKRNFLTSRSSKKSIASMFAFVIKLRTIDPKQKKTHNLVFQLFVFF